MEKVLAQTLKIGSGNQSYTINSGFTGLPTTISALVKNAFPFIFALAGVGLLLMIIAAGFTLMTSAGDAKKMESGKNRLTFAIVGFLVIFTAFWIVQLFGTMFGVEPIESLFY
jgi:hypothetical protein